MFNNKASYGKLSQSQCDDDDDDGDDDVYNDDVMQARNSRVIAFFGLLHQDYIIVPHHPGK